MKDAVDTEGLRWHGGWSTEMKVFIGTAIGSGVLKVIVDVLAIVGREEILR